MSVLDEVGLARAEAPAVRRWVTPAGVSVARTTELLGTADAARVVLEQALDRRRGLLIHRGDDYAIGYTDPPVEVVVGAGRLAVRALNDRGRILLPALRSAIAPMLDVDVDDDTEIGGPVAPHSGVFAEELRTRYAGVFRALRALVAGMDSRDELLGLYGAFGYDLIFEVDPIPLRQARAADHRDLVLHLPDEIVELDFARGEAVRHRYEFTVAGRSTAWCDGATESREFEPADAVEPRDHAPGEYADVVNRAMPLFRAGELFEVVPSQVFRRPCTRTPASLFRRLRETNPAPHSLFANLGDGEYLVGASPEMFVGVDRDQDGLLVRTSPISGTIRRGADALQDAANIRELLNSAKDESELTMCTDVDRNDKARVCVPGTVRVTARRKIEMYSALIHTVDHVEGRLRDDRDALDAFLAHLWAVTVTGAPKLAAVEFIERTERSPRRWYGGAVGRIGFDGTLDTVLTLRTIHVLDGVASVRAGATLLYDSDPAAEEAETELKAKALLRVLDEPAVTPPEPSEVDKPGAGLRFLLVDHRDSFVHCLADYLRQTGAEVVTYRAGSHLPMLDRERPDLVVLSPGPGRPSDFDLSATIARAEELGIPVFGVCLGLQGIVEHFGGTLGVLDRPVHGKQSVVRVLDPDSPLVAGLPAEFEVGRYHSLHAAPGAVAGGLDVVAATEDGVVMAVTHRARRFAAVQFHPESIMTAAGGIGRRLIDNAVAALVRQPVA
jgi:anthranilate synthase